MKVTKNRKKHVDPRYFLDERMEEDETISETFSLAPPEDLPSDLPLPPESEEEAPKKKTPYDYVLAALKRNPGMLSQFMDKLQLADPDTWADLMQQARGEQQQLGLEEAFGDDIPYSDLATMYKTDPFSSPPAETSATPGTEKIDRNTYRTALQSTQDFHNTTEAHYEMIRASMPESTVIDPSNPRDVHDATSSGDPNIIVPLGIDSRYIYFKNADRMATYWRIPIS